jgi:hypothetical protein
MLLYGLIARLLTWITHYPSNRIGVSFIRADSAPVLFRRKICRKETVKESGEETL